jgi:UTP--glucose-1-phosphate uridylyltransferase
MNHAPIRKAVIPVAGFGTRFLPFTKAMPKEMLPIIDTPVIQYVVEEAVASGITDIILVTSYAKRPVEDHFDTNFELEAWLEKQGKVDQLAQIRKISGMANFTYVRQKGPYGNATPVANVEHLIGKEPFAVLWGDEIFQCKRPRLQQMMEVYEKYGDPVIGAVETDDEGTKKFGIFDPAEEVSSGVFRLKGLMEKPGPEKAPSRLASMGSYILTPDIFEELHALKPGHAGEYFLPDAIRGLLQKRSGYCKVLEGTWFDAGSKIGWLKANIAFALEREDLAPQVRAMLQSF